MKVSLKIEFEVDADSLPKDIGEIMFDNISASLPRLVVVDDKPIAFIDSLSLVESEVLGD